MSVADFGQIFVKFDIGDFCENLSRKPEFGSNRGTLVGFIVACDMKSP
jgi:hypothetical protein